MSRIYFHSLSGETCVSGAERAYMGHLIGNIAFGVLESTGGLDEHWLATMLPDGCYAKGYCPPQDSRPGWAIRYRDSLKLWLNHSYGEPITLADGRQLSPFRLALNTAMAIGSDPIRLFARLHGQCEIHCWVRGENRDWLAGIIAEGIRDGVYRDEAYRGGSAGQWSEVRSFLESDDSEPVVCSYSVCEQFPNRGIAAWEPPDGDEDGESWYDLDDGTRWRLAMAGLESHSGKLEMNPSSWSNYRFGDGVDYLGLYRLSLDAKAAIDAAEKGVEG